MQQMQTFYYNHQLRNYLVQFMAVFYGMKVQVGWNEDTEPRLANVPVYGASKDRVVAAIKNENTQNKPIRLPAMSAWLSRIDLAPERRKGVPMERRNTVMPTGGLFPDDFKVVQQRMPVPYKATFDLYVWASNQDQHYQILEQILMIFNPTLQIQTSDEAMDWTRITSLELVGISPEENMAPGADRRVIQTTLTFETTVYISAPVNVHDNFVKDIYLRVGAVSTGAVKSEDIISELDAQGIPYELKFSLDDIDIGE